jgi:muramoyltetrapeptide carboxypeptidase LdcA involved in peptidoglycan recycling
LQGTEFWPGLADSILYLEADGEMSAEYFDRHLQSVLNQEESAGITALLLGRFQESSRIDEAILRRILLNKRELAGIPVVYNLDFGHTSPMFTFPIGGTAHLVIGNSGEIALKIVRH